MNVHPRDESAAQDDPAPGVDGPFPGLGALLDVLPVGVVVLDRGMHVRKMNPTAGRLVGWRPDAARDAHCREVMNCVLCDDDCVARRATATGRTHLGGSVCVRTRAGGTVPSRLDAVALGGGAVALALRPDAEGDAGPTATVACDDQDERIRAALRRSAGSVTVAARLLGVHRTTMWRWMAERGLTRRDFRPQ